jgi:pimeloyl-ACP methyl ester carboxylesterase
MTSAAAAPPALLLVHGAWHGPWCWDRLVNELSGVDVHTVALPSAGPDPAVLGDLYGDAAVVRAAIAELGRPVVVCGHSYGGIVITEAAAELPNVVGLVYLCAFQLDVGEGLADVAGPRVWQHVDEATGSISVAGATEVFYGDVDPALVVDVLPRIGHQSVASFQQRLTRAAWHTVPSTYVVCENDRAIPLEAQQAMARRAKRALRMPTSHSPFLSRPGELADLLRAELAAARLR